jgi:hypothetical protein
MDVDSVAVVCHVVVPSVMLLLAIVVRRPTTAALATSTTAFSDNGYVHTCTVAWIASFKNDRVCTNRYQNKHYLVGDKNVDGDQKHVCPY